MQRVHNHHNFAWWEKHDGRRTLVVRKGATPAFPGQQGFIGGSMGDDAVIVEGVDSPKSREALYSTVHGAGRVMSRTQAAGKIDRRTGKQLSCGVVNWPKWQHELKARGIELRGGGADEAPECYKDLKEVLAAHARHDQDPAHTCDRSAWRWLGKTPSTLTETDWPGCRTSSVKLGVSPKAGVAQLVEQLIRNQQVVRSIRIAGSNVSKHLQGSVIPLAPH